MEEDDGDMKNPNEMLKRQDDDESSDEEPLVRIWIGNFIFDLNFGFSSKTTMQMPPPRK